jgi:hypothetical protein
MKKLTKGWKIAMIFFTAAVMTMEVYSEGILMKTIWFSLTMLFPFIVAHDYFKKNKLEGKSEPTSLLRATGQGFLVFVLGLLISFVVSFIVFTIIDFQNFNP